jgi:hypothetical protein
MLMLEAKSAPLLLTIKLYFTEKYLVERANLPYGVTQVRPEPPRPSYAQGLPPAAPSAGKGQPPIVVDADVEEDDDQDSQYILQE